MAFPISCASCGASFNIPDEIYQRRVAGRLVTIKCKHCRAPIQVDGRQADTHDKLGKSGAKDAALKDRKAEAPAETPTGGAASEAAASGGT